MPAWHALTIHPKHEHLAARALQNQGFEAYLPMHRLRRRWSDRTKTLDAVLFPGYAFCRFESRDKLRVLSSPAVRGIVSIGRDPVPVDEAEIAGIQALVASGKPIDLCPYLRMGEYVRIQHGLFAAVRGVIMRAQENWRVIVSVEALGCSVSVEVDADQVLPERKPLHLLTTFPPERIAHGHL